VSAVVIAFGAAVGTALAVLLLLSALHWVLLTGR
jgi:hypothetical protein